MQERLSSSYRPTYTNYCTFNKCMLRSLYARKHFWLLNSFSQYKCNCACYKIFQIYFHIICMLRFFKFILYYMCMLRPFKFIFIHYMCVLKPLKFTFILILSILSVYIARVQACRSHAIMI